MFFLSLRSEENANCIIRHNRKLCTYRYFKNEYIYEPYLNVITKPYTRKLYTRFKISAHNLHVESCRYRNVFRKQILIQSSKTQNINEWE